MLKLPGRGFRAMARPSCSRSLLARGINGNGHTRPLIVRPIQLHDHHNATISSSKSIRTGAATAHHDAVASFSELFDVPASTPASTKKHKAAPGRGKVAIHLCMVQPVEYGQFLRVLGSAGELGQWDAGYGPDMKWHEGHKWTLDVALPVGSYEFKFARVHRSGHVEWEPGSNRQLEVPQSAAELQVVGSWGQTQETEVLELREQQRAEQQRRRQKQQQEQEILDASVITAAGANVRAKEVSAAAAAAETLQQMLHHASKAGAASHQEDGLDGAGIAAAKAAAAAEASEVQALADAVAAAAADIELLEALSAAVARAAATGAAAGNKSTGNTAASALAEANVADATAATAASIASASNSFEEAEGSGSATEVGHSLSSAVTAAAEAVVAEGTGNHQQLVEMLAELRCDMKSSMSDVAATMHDVQGELLQVQHQMEALQAEKHSLQLAAAAGEASNHLPAGEMAEIDVTLNSMKNKAAVAAVAATAGTGAKHTSSSSSTGSTGDAQALSGLHSAVLSWRQELLSFRQDSLELREEIDTVKGALVVVENQLELTASTVGEALQGVGQQLQANTAAVADVKDTVKSVGDNVSGLLMLRLDQLRDELRDEVRSVTGVLQAGAKTGDKGGSRAVADEDTAAAVVGLLQSSSVAQYFKGFVYCMMMAAGLWTDGLQEEVKGDAMRLTWGAYCNRWADTVMSSWRQQLSKPDELVQAAAMGGVNNSTRTLALHALWSITELSRHSTQVRSLLQSVCTPEEADLMMQLNMGADPAACAKVLRRWMHKANAAAAAAATPAAVSAHAGLGAAGW